MRIQVWASKAKVKVKTRNSQTQYIKAIAEYLKPNRGGKINYGLSVYKAVK